jgi:hypothetical protein
MDSGNKSTGTRFPDTIPATLIFFLFLFAGWADVYFSSKKELEQAQNKLRNVTIEKNLLKMTTIF